MNPNQNKKNHSRKSVDKIIVVRNISIFTSREIIEDNFSKFGKIKSVDVKLKKTIAFIVKFLFFYLISNIRNIGKLPVQQMQ